jgi:hypothetical protein
MIDLEDFLLDFREIIALHIGRDLLDLSCSLCES